MHRVSAKVDGRHVWFESSDSALLPSAEAFACAFLVPAMHLGAGLVVDGRLDGKWLSNCEALQGIFGRWWNYPSIDVQCGGIAESSTGGQLTALFFSGGVDSSYSLMRGSLNIDSIVYVHGYDVPLREIARVRLFERSFREIAEATGVGHTLIRTNLREHPTFNKVSWERSHGGALAAMGRLLPGIGRLVISATFHRRQDVPWGSHWCTDALWSSEGLDVVHFGEEVWRSEKIEAIADEPLIQRNLRVCWQENIGGVANCCQCEKCIRTMIVLKERGRLELFKTFTTGHSLEALLDMLPCIRWVGEIYFEEFLRRYPGSELAGRVRALVERSAERSGKRGWVRRFLPWA